MGHPAGGAAGIAEWDLADTDGGAHPGQAVQEPQIGLEAVGEVLLLLEILGERQALHDDDVLLIDDILESGHTLAFAKDLIAARGANRVCTCVLLEKPTRRVVDVEADFLAYRCPDVFVVGYGMDLDHRFRELPFVGRIVQ